MEWAVLYEELGDYNNNPLILNTDPDHYIWNMFAGSTYSAYAMIDHNMVLKYKFDMPNLYDFQYTYIPDLISAMYGCNDLYACNYNEDAVVDDGSCCIDLWGECYNIAATTTLNLANSDISGEIFPEIMHLTNLHSLMLKDNDLEGVIPNEIGELANLSYLFLGNNRLSGEIPEEFSNLMQLSVLSLNNNELSGAIPEGVCNLIEN